MIFLSPLFFLKDERVCKPGSVLDRHLSRRAVADALQPPPRDGRAGHMSLRGVAPDRVYITALSPAGACALTARFHPYRAERGGISLLHLSEGHPWRALPVILALWSPDFPHAQPFGSCPRLSDPLDCLFYAENRFPSSFFAQLRTRSGYVKIRKNRSFGKRGAVHGGEADK